MADRVSWNAELERALAATLEHCRQIPFYRERLGTKALPRGLEAQLDALPVLSKPWAISFQQDLMLAPASGPGRISSGTTRQGGRFLEVQTTRDELYAIQVFLTSGRDWDLALDSRHWNQETLATLERERGAYPSFAPPMRTLVVHNLHYELPKTFEGPTVLETGWGHHPNWTQRIRALLESPTAPIECLRIESGTFVKLTLLLLQAGFEPRKSAVKAVGVIGFLTHRWRRWLEERWGAELVEIFSLSEFRQPAKECVVGGHFHFDEVPVVTEVLDPLLNHPISQGSGRLTLTSLYPFSQQHPLLRYATGDIVEIVPCDRTALLGFRWRGRQRHCVPWEERGAAEAIFGEREVLDALDDCPFVARSSDDFETLGLLPAGSVGWPLFRFEVVRRGADQPLNLLVHVSLNHSPHLFRAQTQAWVDGVENTLMRTERGLAEAVKAGRLSVHVVLHGPKDDTDALLRWSEYQGILGERTPR